MNSAIETLRGTITSIERNAEIHRDRANEHRAEAKKQDDQVAKCEAHLAEHRTALTLLEAEA